MLTQAAREKMNNAIETDDSLRLPSQPIDRLVSPLSRFLKIESSSGVLLLGCALAALVIANSPLADSYEAFWKSKIGFTVQQFLHHADFRVG